MLRNFFLQERELAKLKALAAQCRDARKKLDELGQLVNDVTIPLSALTRGVVAYIGAKSIMGLGADGPTLARTFLGMPEYDSRCAEKISTVLLEANGVLRVYYSTTGRNRVVQIVICPNAPRALFIDRAAVIYVPDLQNRNPFADEAGLCHKLPDVLARNLESYCGVRVSRVETGGGSGPLFRLQGHIALIGDQLRAGITISSLKERTVISDHIYIGSLTAPKAFMKRVAARIISDLQGHVEIDLTPRNRPPADGLRLAAD